MCVAPGAGSGFFLHQLLLDQKFYGADGVVLTSASSKFSLATAHLLRQEDRQKGTIKRVIGLTSAKNKAFVESTQLYDAVVTYDEELPEGSGIMNCYVDVAGDADLYKKHRLTALCINYRRSRQFVLSFRSSCLFAPNLKLTSVVCLVLQFQVKDMQEPCHWTNPPRR
jgi:hypothetical protein